jgi:hypothetical protein
VSAETRVTALARRVRRNRALLMVVPFGHVRKSPHHRTEVALWGAAHSTTTTK